MDDDTAHQTGLLLTPSKKDLESNGSKIEHFNENIQRNKRLKTSPDGDSENYIDLLKQQLSEEKHNSKILRAQIKEMSEQITKLSETITELNKTIGKLHKSEVEKINRKNKKKSPKSKNNISNGTAKETLQRAPTDLHSNQRTHMQNITANQTEEIHDNSGNNGSSGSGGSGDCGSNSNRDSNTINDMLNNSIEMMDRASDHSSSDDDTDDERRKRNINTNTITENEKHEPNTNTFTENERVHRTNKIPPIDVWTEQHQATQQIIRHHMPNFSCVFTRINKSKIRVLPKSIEMRNKLIALLRSKNINYNTYTPSDEKMQSVLLKGTEIDDSQIITDTLNEHGIVPHNVQRYETGYMRKNQIQSNIWQITLQPKTETSTLTNIRYIADWSVKWELQRKRTLTQCKRCQRFNHSASNCMLPYRCVKCVNTHEPGKCPLDANDNKTKPCCVNCKGEHTANNALQCPFFKRQIELKTKPNQKKRTTVHTNTSTQNSQRQHNNQTYANAVSSKQHQQPQQQQQKQQQALPKQNKQISESDIKQIIEDNQKTMRELMQSFIESQSNVLNALLNRNG